MSERIFALATTIDIHDGFDKVKHDGYVYMPLTLEQLVALSTLVGRMKSICETEDIDIFISKNKLHNDGIISGPVSCASGYVPFIKMDEMENERLYCECNSGLQCLLILPDRSKMLSDNDFCYAHFRGVSITKKHNGEVRASRPSGWFDYFFYLCFEDEFYCREYKSEMHLVEELTSLAEQVKKQEDHAAKAGQAVLEDALFQTHG